MDDLQASEEQKACVKEIRARFKEEAERTDQWMLERSCDLDDLDEMTFLWMEAFADRTNDAMRAHDFERVKAHTEHLAGQYRSGSAAVKNLIDVAYAENLMWDVKGKNRKLAWPHIGKDMQNLYIAIWGQPKFD
jgi:hypothetical protein